MIHPQRIQFLNDRKVRPGRYVLYWMQQAQRARCNHALEYAIRQANERKLPLLAVFGITQRFPEANERAYAFMVEGLRETQQALRDRGVRLTVRLQPPVEAVADLAGDAALVVTDRGYLRILRAWRNRLARRITCPFVQVESDIVVPVETVSDKEEYAARTIRPKIRRHLDQFLIPLKETPLERDSLEDLQGGGLNLPRVDLGALLERMRINRGAERVDSFRGGTARAEALLEDFVANKLGHYAEGRNDPGHDFTSHLSPYLHFGQISPLHVALRVRDAAKPEDPNRDAYLEELIVRRELSMNFCHYNPAYDTFSSLPDWARSTLREHADDARAYVYRREELEQARTHDRYWNAAQREMVLRGKMQGYMRMYWGKKILEWMPDPEEAFRLALELNNRYELDGRDANSFAGVAWCFGKHDRPWGEREIFGKVRYMSAAGLERKFDIEAYVRRVDALAEA